MDYTQAFLLMGFIMACSIVTSFFCAGLTAITSKQGSQEMIGYFLRRPFDQYRQRVLDWFSRESTYLTIKKENELQLQNEVMQNRTAGSEARAKAHEKMEDIKVQYQKDLTALQKQRDRKLALLYPVKPVILCTVCMASVWGVCVITGLHGWSWAIVKPTIVSCIISAYINSRL